jgi:hypothetical protein
VRLASLPRGRWCVDCGAVTDNHGKWTMPRRATPPAEGLHIGMIEQAHVEGAPAEGREITFVQFNAAVKILDDALPGLNVNKHRIAVDILALAALPPRAKREELERAADALDEAWAVEHATESLVKNLRGCMACFGHEMRAAIGRTNYAALEYWLQKRDEAIESRELYQLLREPTALTAPGEAPTDEVRL